MEPLFVYFVYGLIDKRTDLPFYIGKGKHDRPFQHFAPQSIKRDKKRNSRKLNKILKLQSLGFEIPIVYYAYFINEQDAYDYETQLIIQYGRKGIDENGILTNFCLGAKPPSFKGKTLAEIIGPGWEEKVEARRQKQLARGGYGPKKHSEETKRKISEKMSGTNNPMYGREKSENFIKIMKEKMSIKSAGANNPMAKTYEIITPNNEHFFITGNLKNFCNDNNLFYGTMKGMIDKNRTARFGNCKGWYINEVSSSKKR
jgi:hypothetical protein